jgi:hypothetical protein
MINFVAEGSSRVSGSSFSFDGVSIPVPSEVRAGDVIVAAAHMPATEFAVRGPTGRFYQVSAPALTTVDILSFRLDGNKGILATYTYVVPDDPPDALDFKVRRDVRGVPDKTDELELTVVVTAYRGVDTRTPIQSQVRSTTADDLLSLVIGRVPAKTLQLSVGNLTDSLEARVNVNDVRIADTPEDYQGSSPLYSVTSEESVVRLLLALNPVPDVPDRDPVPTSGTGVGRLIRPRNPLVVKAQRVQGGVFVEEDVPVPVGAELVFDGLGCCMGGRMTFASNPFWEPYTRRVQVWYTDDETAENLYFTAVALETDEADDLYTTNLLELSKLWLDAPVGLDDYPQHVTITETVDLNPGLTIDRIADTVDEYETWRRFLKFRYEGLPTAVFGVGAEGRYIQGRPEDAGGLELDARLYPDVSPIAAALPPYVTDYYVAPDVVTQAVTVTGQRTDVPALAPRVIEETDAAPDGAEIPDGFRLPFTEPPSYEINIPDRIVIPPIRVVELPGGQAQWVSGARVRITPDTGGGARLFTTLRTQTLPYGRSSGQRRDRLGRFA